MKVAIIGSAGQLGFELAQTAPKTAELQLINRQSLDLTAVTQEALGQLITDADLIVNAAAYTAVDKAESDSDTAYQVNALAVKALAEFSHKKSIPLIHVSTDFVFDGDSAIAYKTCDKRVPQSVYGASKSQGEDFLFDENPNATCIRTSWVYSQHGNNFVKTMIKLMNERDSLKVVADQVGSPTWANNLATFIWRIADKPSKGMLHYSNEGICSWYDFAHAIYLLGQQKALITSDCVLSPILTEQYPTPAKRPAYSLLNKNSTKQAVGVEIPHWLQALDSMMDQLNDRS